MSKTERMLSEMADKRFDDAAKSRGLTREQFAEVQRTCKHEWVNKGYYDECTKCDLGRA